IPFDHSSCHWTRWPSSDGLLHGRFARAKTGGARMLDVFISHSSADSEAAARVEQTLESDGLTAWLDRSEIRLGVLLRNELQSAIKQSRVVILLWSKPAAASRWVAAEVLTAVHLDRFIVPCLLDRTRLPQFLAPSVYLDFRKDEALALQSL